MMEAYHSKMLQTNQQTGALNTAVSRLYFWSRRRRSHHECERFLRGQAVTSSLQHFPQCSWFFTAVTLATTERDRVKMYTTTYLHTNRPQTTKKQNDMAIFSFNSFWPILRYTCIFFTLLQRTSSLSCTRMMLNHILKAHSQIQAYNDFTFTGKNKKTT